MGSEQGSPVPEGLFSGWGRTVPTAARDRPVASEEEVTEALMAAGPRGAIARGLGRSYGDAAQCAGGDVLGLRSLRGLRALDLEAGVVIVRGGTSLDELMRWLVPLGWFVPVTPGTRHVTVGGAVAADIHGKNHHVDGSFVDHVEWMRLVLADGSTVVASPEEDAELFWATAGGMGLTGVVTEVRLRLAAIETSRLVVDTERTADLDSLMAAMVERDHEYRYSVAWIDLVARGAAMGRGVLDRGRFARREELPSAEEDPLAFGAREVASAPPWVPPGLLNHLSVRAFNEVWFRKAPVRRLGHLQTIPQFFHPLDMVAGWNRLYGPRGFLQWQIVVPDGEEEALRRLVGDLSASGFASFLAVLKRFGPANPGPLSFPLQGWTLALDLPVGGSGLGPLLDRLDVRVAEAGGRVYLAKDSRLRPELLPVMYPALERWRAVRERVDPAGALQSDLSRRLGL